LRKSENRSKISNKKKGLLLILSAPSGCGKTTVVTRLLKRHRDWIHSVSVTTRPPREGERRGKDYEFVTLSEFQALEKKGGFLESAKVFGHHYGTRQRVIQEAAEGGQVVVLAVDIQGHRMIRKRLGKSLPVYSIFLLPPSISALRERLEKRSTDSPQEVEKRIRGAEEEIKMANEYDATVINRDLGQTVHEIEALVSKFDRG
jgi:guanylate kinase